MDERFFADDRGNVVNFFYYDEQVARLDREAGETADQKTWDAHGEIEQWARENGYGDEIDAAERI